MTEEKDINPISLCAGSMRTSVTRLQTRLKDSSINGEARKLPWALSWNEVANLNEWFFWSRADQQLPGRTNFRNWIVLGGRGAGKTRAGAEWIRYLALGILKPTFNQCGRIAIVAPTFDEARMVMIEGESGLLAVHRREEKLKFYPTRRLIEWDSGAKAQVFSAEDAEGLRGPQFDAAWCDEFAKWKKAPDVWNNLQLALRIGEVPHAIVTTTPRPTRIVRELIADAATVVTRSKTKDNETHLAPSFLKMMRDIYGNSRLARQELDGEIVTSDPDAIFNRDVIENFRVRKAPEMQRIVVAVDPSVTAGRKSNACGIVVAGLGSNGRCYVLEDASCRRLTPNQWAQRVVNTYHRYNADRIVAETNQGGSMVEAVLRQVDPNIAMRGVYASRSKLSRAEPVAALYEQGRVAHVGAFRDLEDEMCDKPEPGQSPDRMDALVWAVTELVLTKRTEPRIRVL
jgi:phage terminase large subunit-like protein